MTALAEAPEVLARAVAGDKDAFADIYREHRGRVFRFIYRRTSNPAIAEDLTADVFVRALRHIDRFEDRGVDVGAWLFVVARNIVADHYRSHRYRMEVTVGDFYDDTAEGWDLVEGGAEGRPEETALGRVTGLTLLPAVRQLADEQRVCVTLRFAYGYSVAETAQAMGTSGGAVKALQYRALRALARLLGGDPR